MSFYPKAIAERGTHGALTAQNDTYKTLWEHLGTMKSWRAINS
ncbi:MAG: hypothetical protein DELT_00748 [Desulfovibrio sp.]